jgi:hypothetical protein
MAAPGWAWFSFFGASVLTFVLPFVSSQLALAQSVFTQQGPKLVGSGALGRAQQGVSVALSADSNTAIVGGIDGIGAAWVFARTVPTSTHDYNDDLPPEPAAAQEAAGVTVGDIPGLINSSNPNLGINNVGRPYGTTGTGCIAPHGTKYFVDNVGPYFSKITIVEGKFRGCTGFVSNKLWDHLPPISRIMELP